MESPNYIGSIQQGTKTIKYTSYKHPSNHTEKIEWLPTIEIQSYSFFFFFFSFKPAIVLLESSKHQLFLSSQMHHIKQWGTAIQITPLRWWPNFLSQHVRNSTTIFGIAQYIPNMVNTIDHNSKTVGQCNKRWSTNSPLLLHIQHQSRILLHKLSIVKIVPKAAIQTKNATLEATFCFQILLQEKDWVHTPN